MNAVTVPADQIVQPTPPDSETQRALPTPFVTKTYQMVEDPAVDDAISWKEDGCTFVVWRPAEFALDLLPKYFKHNNFSSFVRQLNTYGFRKIAPDRWEFSNDCFRRGEKRLLCDIHRRKISLPTVVVAVPPTVRASVPVAPAIPVNRARSPENRSGLSTNSGEVQVKQTNVSSSMPAGTTLGVTAELLEDNERLRKENRKLANELAQMKNICNVIHLMSKYATGQGSGHSPPEALELMPLSRILEEADEICAKSDEPLPSAATGSSAWYCEASPMLFGVSIGEKRCREEEDEDVQQPTKNNPPEVKIEPLDPVFRRQPWEDYRNVNGLQASMDCDGSTFGKWYVTCLG
ncbi:Heat stress transcription factor B-2c [Platanthera guangdongensis]|uniref:Heat stress transcription factor B-2c n=1 Tax=Platanthera guangdongensis TaxID=2320717 RepID=A0ABR2M1V0_9ASPA